MVVSDSSSATHPAPFRVMCWWGLANLVAWALVYTPGVFTFFGGRVPLAVMFAVSGFLIAIPQHWLLARWYGQRFFALPLCASAWAVSLWLSERDSFLGPAAPWLAIVGAPVAALVQYAGIRVHTRRALWWVPASTGCMALAVWVGVHVGFDAFDHGYRWEWFFNRGYYVTAGGAAGGATYGLLSGLVLGALLTDRRS